MHLVAFTGSLKLGPSNLEAAFRNKAASDILEVKGAHSKGAHSAAAHRIGTIKRMIIFEAKKRKRIHRQARNPSRFSFLLFLLFLHGVCIMT
jgi:hypothetical protein